MSSGPHGFTSSQYQSPVGRTIAQSRGRVVERRTTGGSHNKQRTERLLIRSDSSALFRSVISKKVMTAPTV
jgi:hypothetical protein